jgi:hypothetical protein
VAGYEEGIFEPVNLQILGRQRCTFAGGRSTSLSMRQGPRRKPPRPPSLLNRVRTGQAFSARI